MAARREAPAPSPSLIICNEFEKKPLKLEKVEMIALEILTFLIQVCMRSAKICKQN